MEEVDTRLYNVLLQKPDGVDNDTLHEALPDLKQEDIVNSINRLLQSGLLELMQVGTRILYRGVSRNEIERLSGLSSDEKLVFKHIENSNNEGIWVRTLKQKTNLLQGVINRCLKGLEQKALIKSVKSVKHPTRKLYMLIELTPSSILLVVLGLLIRRWIVILLINLLANATVLFMPTVILVIARKASIPQTTLGIRRRRRKRRGVAYYVGVRWESGEDCSVV
ncbi:RNA polymerase Rpc34 subunit-domain-containing protein [Kickxella alabastrina]|uniref:RNA polymerase Rpc34 subunit-domain-containing protein n=1 Tax=Kickxella alabastrina TaxID=61397 RepID=UPI0022206073|nr:RNA polymerase Rpc34 subunit-domain-containing protein [Kickxella alabastrina]KAI7834544.1 RNA polymerase Rpc34 subunit-domain-containing protein [Kickxella alabastrina]